MFGVEGGFSGLYSFLGGDHEGNVFDASSWVSGGSVLLELNVSIIGRIGARGVLMITKRRCTWGRWWWSTCECRCGCGTVDGGRMSNCGWNHWMRRLHGVVVLRLAC